MFQHLTSVAKQVADKATGKAIQVTAQVERFLAQATSTASASLQGHGGSVSDTSPFTVCSPWDQIPEAWQDDLRSACSWVVLVHTLLEDPNTFLVDYERVVTNPRHLEILTGQQPDEDEQASSSESLKAQRLVLPSWFDVHLFVTQADRMDVCECMLRESALLARQRYELVPRWTTEQRFWANALARLVLLACERPDPALEIIRERFRTLNTETSSSNEIMRRRRGYGISSAIDADYAAHSTALLTNLATWWCASTQVTQIMVQAEEEFLRIDDEHQSWALLASGDPADAPLRASIHQTTGYRKQRIGTWILEMESYRSDMYAVLRRWDAGHITDTVVQPVSSTTSLPTCQIRSATIDGFLASVERTLVSLYRYNAQLSQDLLLETHRPDDGMGTRGVHGSKDSCVEVTETNTVVDKNEMVEEPKASSPAPSQEPASLSCVASPSRLHDVLAAKLPWEEEEEEEQEEERSDRFIRQDA